jgi:hypothetical protein
MLFEFARTPRLCRPNTRSVARTHAFSRNGPEGEGWSSDLQGGDFFNRRRCPVLTT